MALASLCSALTRYPPAKQRFDFRFTPIVIDHKARQGSSEEVDRVCQRLRKLGTAPPFGLSVHLLTWKGSTLMSQA